MLLFFLIFKGTTMDHLYIRYIYYIGFSASIITLSVALFIFLYYK
jgi:hypothetical protein